MKTVGEIASAVRARTVSSVEVVDAALARIDAVDPMIRAWCARDAERARNEARAVDARIAAGDDVGPLAGVPFGVKDLEPAEGYVTTYGDPVHAADPPAARDSVEVARLRAAGAIVLGKLNTPAYGFHAETDNLVHGPTHNPWALGRTCGGSSGGSAAAIASGMVPLATGSDGGGSIRIPAEVCGISGFKPTHGVVPSGDDAAPTWGHMSTRGPMTRTLAEAALVLDVVKGLSTRDIVSFDLAGSFADAAARASLTGVRVGWSPTLGYAEIDPRVLEVCEQAMKSLAAAGLDVVEVVDDVFGAPPMRAWAMRAAAGSWHTATTDPTPWDGRFLPAAQLTASFGEKIDGQSVVEGDAGAHAATLHLAELFERIDILVCPGQATIPPRVGEASPFGPGWAASFTMGFNLVRAPAAVVPAGFVEDEGEMLPIGLQFAAPRGADLRVMTVAVAAEAALGFVDQRPPTFAPAS